MKYRAEIDGLRALAVIPVILFHAGFELFSGGFVGVDVFFVISGYLITTILIEDIEKNRFSLVNFYERRARRILPALFFVMFICIPFAWMWMLPSQMTDFSQSLIAVSLFASNILFWRESGYFDAAAEEKPLLHTWSLAVEEQYYVLFPIFLFFAWRFGKNKVFWMVVFFAAISLALSEWGWRNRATANFYLVPTRVWELLAGSIAAFIVQKRGVQANNSLSLIGLAAILFSIFAYDKNTPFPSVYALVPVSGVVLLVLFAEKETLVSKLLSTKAFVGIGLISYSAYLWHQPLFAFARIRLLEEPSNYLMVLFSLVSLILAAASWKYIEEPFRSRSRISPKEIFYFSLSGLLLFISFGFFGHFGHISTRDFEFRNNLQVSVTKTIFEKKCGFGVEIVDSNCQFIGDLSKTPSVLILGDSHAGAMKSSIANFLKKSGLSAYRIGFAGCTPIQNVAISYPGIFKQCIRLNDYVYEEIIKNKEFDNIIVISRWTAHWEGSPFNNEEGGEEKFSFTTYLQGVSDKKITTDKIIISDLYKESFRFISNKSNLILVYPVPEAGWNVPNNLNALRLSSEKISKDTLSTNYQIFVERNLGIYSLFESLAIKHNKVYPEKLFCNSSLFNRCITHIDGVPLYYDDDHLSKLGSDMVVNEIFKYIR